MRRGADPPLHGRRHPFMFTLRPRGRRGVVAAALIGLLALGFQLDAQRGKAVSEGAPETTSVPATLSTTTTPSTPSTPSIPLPDPLPDVPSRSLASGPALDAG